MDGCSGDEADDDMGGDDEVELTDEESSNDEDIVAEVFRIDTNIFDYETPLYSAYNEFNYLSKLGSGLTFDTILWGLRTHERKYKTRLIYDGTKTDGYCNGGNLPETYIVRKPIRYQDLEWYEALEDCELKDEALRNKAIIEAFIKEYDDESHYEQGRQ
ncbi:hypothetical protein Tco_0950066 [Tanacetum coccineum]